MIISRAYILRSNVGENGGQVTSSVRREEGGGERGGWAKPKTSDAIARAALTIKPFLFLKFSFTNSSDSDHKGNQLETSRLSCVCSKVKHWAELHIPPCLIPFYVCYIFAFYPFGFLFLCPRYLTPSRDDAVDLKQLYIRKASEIHNSFHNRIAPFSPPPRKKHMQLQHKTTHIEIYLFLEIQCHCNETTVSTIKINYSYKWI